MRFHFNSLLSFLFLWGISLSSPAGLMGQDPEEVPLEKDTVVLQSIYRFDKEYRTADILIASSSSTLLIAAHYSHRDDLTTADVIDLNPEDIPAYEREAVFNESVKAQDMSDVLLASSFLFPLATTFAVPKEGAKKKNLLYLYFQTLAFTNSLNIFAKVVSSRKRPYVYNPEVSIGRKTNSDAQASFYSGHTVNVAAMTFLTAKVLNDYYPESKIVDWVAWPVAATLPALQGHWRVKAGKHFVTDVALGYVIGAVTGFGIPYLHHFSRHSGAKKKNSSVSLNLQPVVGSVNGFALRARF
jgi:membrane-associated phospholipid phosphatase